MGETPIGTVAMLYTMDPCDVHGSPINGGNHYANANTHEQARKWAEDLMRAGTHLGYTLGSVRVYGREVSLGYGGWGNVRGGRQDSFTVTRADVGTPPAWMSRERTCWDTTVLDRPERVHAMMTDGSCQCGDPQSGFGGRRS